MKNKAKEQMQGFSRVKKHWLHKTISDHMKKRSSSEPRSRTLIGYEDWYKKFATFLYKYDKRKVSLTDSGIGKDYKKFLEDQGYANGTVIAHFKRFLATLNHLEIFHMFTQKNLFKGYAKLSRANEDFFLKDEEVKELLNTSVDDPDQRIALDRFLICCFTGCRISEVKTVRVRDKKTIVYFSSKTQKDVLIPYSDPIRPFIESGRYMKEMIPFWEGRQNILLHHVMKESGWNEPVKKYRMVRNKKEVKEIPRWKAITFHSGRKFFGKMLLDKNVSMYKVSQLLGHASIDTTQRYYAALTREKMMDEANDVINKF